MVDYDNYGTIQHHHQQEVFMVSSQETGLQKIGEPSASIITVAANLPPRDLVKVENDIRAAIKNNPSLAELCIYCKPVGMKNGRQAFSTGPSIRFAEIGQQCFQALWVNGTVDQDNKRVMATVVCFDLRTLNVYYGTSSKSIVGRNGLYSPSMIETTTNAAFSIARRNALLQAMRPQIESVMEDAKNAAIKRWCVGDKIDHKDAYKALHADYQRRWGTTVDQLNSLVAEEGSPEDKLIMAIGVRNYLIDNPDSYEDVFGAKPKATSGNSVPEPLKQTAKQQFNTLCLQLDSAGKEEDRKELVNEYCAAVAKSVKEWSDEDYSAANNQISAFLAKVVTK